MAAPKRTASLVKSQLEMPLSYWNLCSDATGSSVSAAVLHPVRINNAEYQGWGNCVRLDRAVFKRREWWIPAPDIERFVVAAPKASANSGPKSAKDARRGAGAVQENREYSVSTRVLSAPIARAKSNGSS